MGRLNLDDGLGFRVYPTSRSATAGKDECMNDVALDDCELKIAVIGSGLDALPLLFDRHVRLPSYPQAVRAHRVPNSVAFSDAFVSTAPTGEKKRISSSPRALALSNE